MAIHPPKKPINWVAVRAEYEAGGISMQGLADRLGVSRKTVERRAAEGKWKKDDRSVSEKVSEKIAEVVREKVVTQRVEKALSDLEMIDNAIKRAYIESQAMDFKSAEGAYASLDKMLKMKLEYSDEHIEAWLLKKGYVAVPIPELTPSSPDS